MDSKAFKEYLKKNYPRTSSFTSGLSLMIVDTVTLLVSVGFGFFVVNLINTSSINMHSFVSYSVYFPIILVLYVATGLYPGIMLSPVEEVKKFCLTTGASFMLVIFTIFLDKLGKLDVMRVLITYSNRTAICISFLLAMVAATILLPAMRELSKHLLAKFPFWGVPAVIYCTGDSADVILKKLFKNPHLGYKPAVIIDSAATEDSVYPGTQIPVLPGNSPLIADIHSYNIKNAILCGYKGNITNIMNSYRYTITVPVIQNAFTTSQQIKDIDGIIGFASTHNLTFRTNLFIKRTIDVLFILIFLPILLPVFLVLALLIKCTSRGPVFYRHKRVGKNGKVLRCWKFRSMYIDADERLKKILAEDEAMRKEWEENQKFVNDPRITGFGKFLRKTSLDELPQLINIFLGEMSFVGPRPVTEAELVKYGDNKDYVLSVTPGLSGMWQVSGRSETGYEERVFYDTFYIQNWSVWLDIWILIKTVWVVVSGKGAY